MTSQKKGGRVKPNNATPRWQETSLPPASRFSRPSTSEHPQASQDSQSQNDAASSIDYAGRRRANGSKCGINRCFGRRLRKRKALHAEQRQREKQRPKSADFRGDYFHTLFNP